VIDLQIDANTLVYYIHYIHLQYITVPPL